MAATIKFDQSGLPAGTNNRSRSDIVAGTAVSITNVSPGTSNACELLGKPTDDDTAAITGTDPNYSITPKAGTFGKYRIRLTVDGDEQINTFTVKSPERDLEIGAHNERADEDANLADTDPGTWVDDSESNEGGHYKGWWPEYEENMKAIDQSLLRIERKFTQATHGFSLGDGVYLNGSTWTVSSGDVLTSHPTGVVSEVIDTDTFRVCFRGIFNWASHGKTVGSQYYAIGSGGSDTSGSDHWLAPMYIPVDANYVYVNITRETPERTVNDSPSTDEDDYTPGNVTQWAEATVFRCNPTADVAITGFDAVADRRYPRSKLVLNISSAYTLLLKHDNGSSTSSNRIYNENEGNHLIRPLSGIVIWYDETTLRWRTMGLWTRATTIQDTIAAQQNDYNPTGISYADIVRVTLTGSQDITGLNDGNGNLKVRFVNADATDTLTFKHDDAASTATYRFYCPGNADFELRPGESITWEKDIFSSRWRASAFTRRERSDPAIVTVTPSSDQNNYAPSSADDWAACDILRCLPTNADITITGFADVDASAGIIVKWIWNINADNEYNIILAHDSSSSTDVNRIYCEGDVDAVIHPNEGAMLYKDQNTNRWRLTTLRKRPIVADVTIAAQKDNYNANAFGPIDTLRITLTGDQDITGIVPRGVHRLTLINIDADDTLTLKHESTSSTTTNRFDLPGDYDIWLEPGESITLQYDDTSDRWRPVGQVRTRVIETEQHIPIPEQPTGNANVSSYQSAPSPQYLRGGIYRLDRDIEVNRLVLRRTTSASCTMRVAIYQAPMGEAIDGDWSLVYEGTFAWSGTGVIVHSMSPAVKLRKGRFAFLFGPTTTTYYWIDCYTISTFNMMNTTMPAEVYPCNFETAISGASSAPSVFDPVVDATANNDNHCAIIRFRST